MKRATILCSSTVFFFTRCVDCDDFTSNMTRIYVFPGEGSQKVGMGKELFERFPEQVAIADAELGYSVLNLCLRDPLNQLNQMLFAQPSLFVVNALTFLNHLFETGKLPGLVAGHGLGEYNALSRRVCLIYGLESD